MTIDFLELLKFSALLEKNNLQIRKSRKGSIKDLKSQRGTGIEE
jgi:hypothetical protein